MSFILTEDLRKFLASEYGVKILRTAKLYGQTHFHFGKKSYKIDELLTRANSMKMNCSQEKKE